MGLLEGIEKTNLILDVATSIASELEVSSDETDHSVVAAMRARAWLPHVNTSVRTGL